MSLIPRLNIAFAFGTEDDGYFSVTEYILNQNKIPNMENCDLCYHKKLYFVFTAFFLKITNIQQYSNQLLFARFVNIIAGLITLYVIYLFINQQSLPYIIKLISFFLIAFNPLLMGMNVSTSNDSFVILFSTLAIYFFYYYLKTQKKINFLLSLIFTILSERIFGFVS